MFVELLLKTMVECSIAGLIATTWDGIKKRIKKDMKYIESVI